MALSGLYQQVQCASGPELAALLMGALGLGLAEKWRLVTGAREKG